MGFFLLFLSFAFVGVGSLWNWRLMAKHDVNIMKEVRKLSWL